MNLMPYDRCTRRQEDAQSTFFLESINNETYFQSFFLRIIREWNAFESNVISSTTVDGFRASLLARLSPAQPPGQQIHRPLIVLTNALGQLFPELFHICRALIPQDQLHSLSIHVQKKKKKKKKIRRRRRRRRRR